MTVDALPSVYSISGWEKTAMSPGGREGAKAAYLQLFLGGHSASSSSFM